MKVNKKVSYWVILTLSLLFLQSVSFANSMVDSWALGLEKDIGSSNYQSIIAQKTIVQLPSAEEKDLHDVFRRLVKNCNRSKELNFTVTVVRDKEPNAFALPAGYVFINTGLLSMVKNDGELAGILGHEIAHIDRYHAMKAIYRAVSYSVVLNLLFINHHNWRDTQEMSALAGVSLRLSQLGYSRKAELEADRHGVEIMEKAGYNKQDILNFWERFQRQNGDSSKNLTFLSTHPSIDARIEQIKKLP